MKQEIRQMVSISFVRIVGGVFWLIRVMVMLMKLHSIENVIVVAADSNLGLKYR